MNKKGFTLIELIVSIILVSIVLISMTGTLVKLKDTYSVVNEDADARIYGATISKIVNDTSNDTEKITSNAKQIRTKTYEKTTLRYSDSTTGDVKTILIKTIELVIRTNNEDGNDSVTTSGYKFTTLSQESFKYENVNNSTKVDKMTHITIGLSDEKYNIDLYSSGTYDN